MLRLLVATTNPNKVREIRQLLAGTAVDIVTLAEWPAVTAPEETGRTFEENARAKALYYAAATGELTVAEDSGLSIDALDGAPGVQSARFAGEPPSDARNNARLVEKLAGIADRRAHYYCMLALMRHGDDPEPILAEGRWEGTIIDLPRGGGGFGYDPHFLDAETGLTGAELPLEKKNELSHRGKAIRSLVARLESVR